jgi:ABC-type transporter Mla maintaining outer membrane lipid asymmetry ATPase subunit MlaF
MGSDPAIELRDVEKQYGGLRPLRIRELRASAGDCLMVLGFDRPAAETFINLITGATLPEKGEVVSLGRATRDIVDSDDWLSFAERFGVVSDRIVLLEQMTVAQNLALSFDLEIDPVPAEVMTRVGELGVEVGINAALLHNQIKEGSALLRARVHLGRALALNPAILVFEHPTASLSADEGKRFAMLVRKIWKQRGVTTIGLTLDEQFAKATGGRLLLWQPATGELRRRWRFISQRSP